MPEASIKDILKSFLFQNYSTEIISKSPQGNGHGLVINFFQLLIKEPILASLLSSNPEKYLKEFENCAQEIFNESAGGIAGGIANQSHTAGHGGTFKIAIECLNPPIFMYRDKIPRCKDTGNLVFFRGTCVKSDLPKLLETTKMYYCRKCSAPVEMKYDVYSYNQIPKPTRCPGDSLETCNSTKFSLLDTAGSYSKTCIDYQEIRVQEQVSKLDLGTMPQSITVIMRQDLVDKVKPGQEVLVTAVVVQRWKPGREGERCDVELALLANHVHLLDTTLSVHKAIEESVFTDYWRRFSPSSLMKGTLNHYTNTRPGRDFIVSSLAPELYGLHLPKLILLLILISAPPSSETRPHSHLLIIGSPGTSKSQLLKSAGRLATRHVYTTSTGSSTAGLTVSLSRETGEWALEPGALVLADTGICSIDEFGRLKPRDLSVLHEAMENGTVSVAKAGIVCKLQARCSVMAAMNPKEGGLGIGSPLVSRFDVILALMDEGDPERDLMLSTFILQAECYGKAEVPLTQTGVFGFETLKAYIAYCKTKVPVMGDDAQVVLKAYYGVQRLTDATIHSSTESTTPRTTIRLLESLVRLSLAHARLRCGERVEVCDAVVACLVIEASILGCLGMKAGLFDPAPEDADLVYASQEWILLEKLELTHLVPKEREQGGGDLNLDLNEIQSHIMSMTQRPPPPPPMNLDDDESEDVESGDDAGEDKENIGAEASNVSRQKQSGKRTKILDESEISWPITSPPKPQSLPQDDEEDEVDELAVDDEFEDEFGEFGASASSSSGTPQVGLGMLGNSIKPHLATMISQQHKPLTDDEILDLFTPE